VPLRYTVLERLLLRDRIMAGAGLLLLTLLGWIYLAGVDYGPWFSLMAMPMRHAWRVGDVLLTLAMWAVMMVAMMTPSVAPVVLLTATVERRRGSHAPLSMAWLALAGYFAVWTGASVLATALQWALHEAGLMANAMGGLRAWLAGILLVAVGLYQFAPVKADCLRLCRSPVETLAQYWKPGSGGAIRLGLRHGLYCFGCCWALMLVLFVSGIMNLIWIAILSVLVLAEKLLPRGLWLGRLAGAGLVAWGGRLIVGV
jgi:predicted metal-binding membrane protein